jgi:PAS domain S-box-containing protein
VPEPASASSPAEPDVAANEPSEERFRRMADHAPVLIWLSGPDKSCTWFNKPWLDFVGRPLEQELGNGWTENVHPDDYDRCLKTYTTAFDARQPFRMQYRLRRHDGEYRCILDTGVPLTGAGGDFAGYIGSCIDITERQVAEEALRDSEQRFARFMQHLPGLAWIKDLQGRYVYANESATRAFRTPLLKLYGRTDDDVFPPETAARFRENDRQALASETGMQTIEILEHHDGRVHHSLVNKFPIPSAGGKTALVGGTAFDITDHMQTQEALRQSETQTRRLLDYHQAVTANMGEGLYTLDAHGVVTYVNPAAERMFGWTSGELLGRRMHEVTHYSHPDGRPFAIEECAGFQVLRSGTAVKDHDDMFIRRDGSFFPVVLSSSPILSDGKVAGLVVVFRDVTDRKRTEEALMDREARLRAILDTAADAIITIDYDGIIRSANLATEQMFGYSASEMVGHDMSLLMPSAAGNAHNGDIARSLHTGERRILDVKREVDSLRKDGTVFPTELIVKQIPHLKLFVGVHRDLTQRRQLEHDVVKVASLEQRRIGQDLHDTVGQELTALNLLAGELAEVLRDAPGPRKNCSSG